MHATAHCQTHGLQFKLPPAANTYHLKLPVDPPLQLISSHRTAQVQMGYKSSLCPEVPAAGRCRRLAAARRHRPRPPTPCRHPQPRPPPHLCHVLQGFKRMCSCGQPNTSLAGGRPQAPGPDRLCLAHWECVRCCAGARLQTVPNRMCSACTPLLTY